MAKNDEKMPEATKPSANKYENPSNPLYVHHLDQPSLILATQLLTQDNYPIWSHAMLIALTTKNKDDFVDSTITKPPSSSAKKTKQRTRCNLLVKGWILNDIAQSVMYNDSAFGLWNELNERFSHTNSVHLFHIEQEIHDCVKGSMSIGEYYSKLKGLWDTRDALSPLPPCEGETGKNLLEYQQIQRTIQFLMGLNGVYIAAHGQILLMEHLLAVNKIFSLIIQDEKQRTISSPVIGKTLDVAVFAVKNESQSSNRNHPLRNAHLKCDRCNLTGHTAEYCRQHLQCDCYGYKGHTIDICRKLKKATSHGDNKGTLKSTYVFYSVRVL